MKKITEAGYKKLKEELDYLKKDKRKEIAEKLKLAISFGDLSENAAYHEAKEDQTSTENRIVEIERALRGAVIVQEEKKDYVVIGSDLTINSPDGEEKIKIVGSEESDPLKGWISFSSPLGKNLMGKKKGNKMMVATPDGDVEYEIKNIV